MNFVCFLTINLDLCFNCCCFFDYDSCVLIVSFVNDVFDILTFLNLKF